MWDLIFLAVLVVTDHQMVREDVAQLVEREVMEDD